MITIDKEKLQILVEEYKADFKENIPLELYKWEAVKHFQDNWDLDAEDFPAMLSRSLSKTENLLASMSNFAKGMIVQFAERFPEEVKELFSILFDETLDLKERIESFTISVKQIHAKWDGKEAKSHFQTPNAISTYLWLRFPDRYYIFKPTVAKRMFEKLCNDTVKTSEVDGIIKTYELYDSISEVLRKDEELKGMLSSALTNNCYPDLQMKTAIVDFAYFFSKSHIVKRHLLRKFLEVFPYETLSTMPIEQYTNLKKTSFCYWLEQETSELGSISGATSFKFGIYRYYKSVADSKKDYGYDEQYAWYKAYGENADEAYSLVRDSIVQIATLAKEGKYEEIDKFEKLGTLVKWKIAFIYSNASLIPVFSRDMLEYCAKKFGMEDTQNATFAEMQRYLLNKKGNIEIFQWYEFYKVVEEYMQGDLKELFDTVQKNIDEEYKVTKRSKKFAWIETKDSTIGNSKCHYELCADENNKAGHKKGYIYVETHFETNESSLFHSLKDIEGISGFPWGPSAKHYAVRINNDGWEINKYETKELADILIEEIKKLDNIIGENIRMIMDTNIEHKTINKYDARYEPYIKLLLRNRNLILNGAPGTGKTYLAKQVAAQIIYGGNVPDNFEDNVTFNTQCKFVQFHPSYDYTDFVEGLRPTPPNKDGNIGFRRRDGIFKEFCKWAAVDASSANDENKADYDFIACYKSLVDDIKQGIIKTIELKSGPSQLLGVGTNNTIKWQRNKDSQLSRNCVSLERLSALYEEYDTIEKVEAMTNIDESIRGVIGGANSTYYWAVLREVLSRMDSGQKVQSKTKDNKYIFIIDEINRGEISKIFGELFFSVDPGYRGVKGKVQTQYQNLIAEDDPFKDGFYIPENVYIIGTMNDIDRSVECMDFAMRRRFTFKEITAEESARNMELGTNATERMMSLNNAISEIDGFNSSFHIGAAYYLGVTDYKELWELKLQGLLKEYLRGMPDTEDTLMKFKKAYELSLQDDNN